MKIKKESFSIGDKVTLSTFDDKTIFVVTELRKNGEVRQIWSDEKELGFLIGDESKLNKLEV